MRLNRLRPDGTAQAIEAKYSHVAQVDINSLAIGNGCLGGIRVFNMDWACRLTVMNDLFPLDLAGRKIDAK